jgi:hypothetical protein
MEAISEKIRYSLSYRIRDTSPPRKVRIELELQFVAQFAQLWSAQSVHAFRRKDPLSFD